MITFLPAPDEATWIGTLRLSLRVPGSRSLKDRRHGVRSMKDRLVARHAATVAEVGHLEHHELAVLVACIVGNDATTLRSRLDTMRREAEGHADVELLDAFSEVTRWDPSLRRSSPPG